MTPRPVRFALSILAAVAVLGGCKKEEAKPAEPAQPSSGATATADAGAASASAEPAPPAGPLLTLQGTVTLEGTPPVMGALKKGADPACRGKGAEKDEAVLVKDGKLQNVVVRVTQKPTWAFKAPTEPVIVDQEGCTYKPRVQAAVEGQPIQIKNSDQTLHNVHAYAGSTTVFNQAQPPRAAPINKQLNVGIVKLKCDVHPWMTSYVLISPHPYFGVTGEDGRFEIKDLPAGDYTLEAWHERFGTRAVPVSVKDGAMAPVAISFEAK